MFLKKKEGERRGDLLSAAKRMLYKKSKKQRKEKV